MRYYDLKISDPATGLVFKPSRTSDGFTKSPGGSTFTSWVQGPTGIMQTDPGALDIQFEMPVTAQHEPRGKQYICVYGVGLRMIGQSADLNGMAFSLSGGMKPGLPLANPSQAGLLASGQIYASYGNWESTEQTLNLVVNPGGLVPQNGVCFNWPAGTSLASALQMSFAQAFPQYQPSIAISPSYLLNHQEGGTYPDFATFADFIHELTSNLGAQFTANPDFDGVSMIISGPRIIVFDATTRARTTQLVFTDLLGQPTWLEPAAINFKTVLRADISVGDLIRFPPQGLISPFVLTAPGAAAPNVPSRSKTVFQGPFQVREMYHFANFRQPSGESWVTSFIASPLPATVAA
jgi:hypothetical protein